MRDRPEDYGPQTIARHMSNLAVPAADYLSAVQARPRIIETFVNAVFSQCDVLQVPVYPCVMPTIEATDVGDSEGFDRLLGHLTQHAPVQLSGTTVAVGTGRVRLARFAFIVSIGR